jgi:hypothetical protein
VTAVEVDGRVAELARVYFGLPAKVKVVVEDARTFLRRGGEKFDLVFLDVYAGESTAWYMLTREAMAEMKARLKPDGKLLINNPCWTHRISRSMQRIEATAQAVFAEVTAYPDPPDSDDPLEIGNTCIVAGDELRPQAILPPTLTDAPEAAEELLSAARPAAANPAPHLIMTDDRSDMDYVESNLRIQWRMMIWGWMKSSLLWD